MKNSGYVAVGHLVCNVKTQEDLTAKLRIFVRNLEISLDEKYLDKKKSAWKFDEFAKSTQEICLSSFVDFAKGIMKNPKASNQDFQVAVEKRVWDLISTRSQKNDENLYKLFCIFNRFTDPNRLPFKIMPKVTNFILNTLEIIPSPEKVTDLMDFDQFANFFLDNQYLIASRIDSFFEKVVLDKIMKGNLSGKIVRDRNSFKFTKTPVHLTSNSLILERENLEIPLIGSKLQMINSNQSQTLAILTGSNCKIDLFFSKPYQEFAAFQWKSNIEEVVIEMIPNCLNVLARMYKQYDLRPNFFERKSKCRRLLALNQSTASLNSTGSESPTIKRRNSFS